MAKINEEKVFGSISELTIDEQISFYEKVKALITANIQAHQEMLENGATKYQIIVERIKGN